MNFYNLQGINGCLTGIIFIFIILILFRLFAGFIIATLPIWIFVAGVFFIKKSFKNLSNRKKYDDVENNEYYANNNEKNDDFNEINREAEDVEFHEYKD